MGYTIEQVAQSLLFACSALNVVHFSLDTVFSVGRLPDLNMSRPENCQKLPVAFHTLSANFEVSSRWYVTWLRGCAPPAVASLFAKIAKTWPEAQAAAATFQREQDLLTHGIDFDI